MSKGPLIFVSFRTVNASQVISVHLLLLVITLSKQHHRVSAALQLFILYPSSVTLAPYQTKLYSFILPPSCSFSNRSSDSVSLQWSVMNSRYSEIYQCSLLNW